MKKTNKKPTMFQLKREVKRLQQQLESSQKDAHKFYVQMNDVARELDVRKSQICSIETSLKNKESIISEAMQGLTDVSRENLDLSTTIRTLIKVLR